MARVIFVNRFYWPDEPATGQLLTDLAEALVERGHHITVIASLPASSSPAAITTRRGVNIVHVASTRGRTGGLWRKATDWGTFFFGALRALHRQARPGTVVVAMTDPPLLALGAWWVARLRRAGLIHWVQDIYPEIAIELTGHRWLALLRPWRNSAWRAARAVVTLGEDMARRVARQGVPAERITIVSNWAPRGVAPQPAARAGGLRTAWNVNDKFVVGYSGNLGRVHDLEPVLALAEALSGDRRVALLVIGAGAQRVPLEAEAAQRGLSNLAFHPPQPRDRLAESLAVADVHLVTLRAGCADLVFPSKLFGVAGAGRPVIFIGPRHCEVARCVMENDFGFATTPDDIAGLAGYVRRLADSPAERERLSARAAAFAARHSLADAVERWDRLLGSVTPPP